jgi:hypothetical protein
MGRNRFVTTTDIRQLPKKINGGQSLFHVLIVSLVLTTLSIITPQAASAAVVLATGTNPSICNQTVSATTGVTAERLANGDCLVKFSSAATITWTVPNGASNSKVLIVGGGGGGGGGGSANDRACSSTGSGREGGGGGGGGGGQVKDSVLLSGLSGSLTVVVGIGGSAGAGALCGTAGSTGGTGGTSSISKGASQLAVADGGGGGGGGYVTGAGGVGGNSKDPSGNTTTGGAPLSTATCNASASDGCFAAGGGASSFGNGASPTLNGFATDSAPGRAGVVVSALVSATYGGGGGGGNRHPTSNPSAAARSGSAGGAGGGGAGFSTGNGADASNFGGGGGGGRGNGAFNPNSSNAGSGGAGFKGLVAISYTPVIPPGASIGTGISTFDATLNSSNILNTTYLASGPLQLSNYPDTAIETVTITSTNGNIRITSATGLSSVVAGPGLSIGFSGTAANINSALDTLIYLAPGTTGTSSLVITVSAAGVATVTRTFTVNIKANQRPLSISNTNLSQSIGETITVTLAGGEGISQGTSFLTSNTGCFIDSSGQLVAYIDTTCSVTATKSGDGAYMSVTSDPVDFDFNPINQEANLAITNTNLVLTSMTDTITLTASGGSGTGAYSFATQSDTCRITGTTLSALSEGNCLVIVTRAPSGKYAVATSQYPTYFYVGISNSKTNSASIIINSYGDLEIGNSITLRTNLTPSGSDLESQMNFSVTGSGCLYDNTYRTLTTYDTITAPTACTVIASWKNSAPYRYSQSDPKIFYFGLTAATPLVIPNYSPKVGDTLRVTATGGDETATANFPIVYRITGANCPAGVISNGGRSIDITATVAAFCTVTASQAAHGIYKFNISASTTISFGRITSDKVLVVQNPPPNLRGGDSITVTATTTTGDVLNQNDVSFTVSGTNCSYVDATKQLTTTGVAYCTVIASWSPSSIYNYAQSAAKTIFFAKYTRTGVLVVKTPSPAPGALQSITLQATYQEGAGAITDVADRDISFILTPSANCQLTGNVLRSTGVAYCTVSALWSDLSSYNYAQSAAKTITFGKATPTGVLAVLDPITNLSALDSITVQATYTVGGVANIVSNSDVSFTLAPGSNCTLTGNKLVSLGIAYCTIFASWSPSSSYTYAQSERKLFSFGPRQPANPLTINNLDSYTAQTSVTLTTVNGNGNPAKSFTLYGATGACSLIGALLTANVATSCTVIASQGAIGNFAATQSSAKTITFNRIASPVLVLPALSSSAGTPLSLRATGGNGGQILYTLSPAGCQSSLSGTTNETLTITANTLITCTVTARQNETNLYKFASVTNSYTFAAVTPTPLSFAANLSGSALETLIVTAVGGDETATATTPIVYKVTGANCPAGVSSNNGRSVDIRTTTVAYCTVFASQAAHGIYKYVISPSVTIAFNAVASPNLELPNLSGTAGAPLLIQATGGNGGQITYSVSGAGCSPLGTSNAPLTITTTGPAYCTVQAKQNAFGPYRFVISTAKTIFFAQSNAPTGLAVTNLDSATAGEPLTLTSNAALISSGIAVSQVKFRVSGGANCLPGDNKTSITTTGEAFCTVIAYWPSSSVYFYKESTPLTIRFLTYDQPSSFTINNSGASTSAVKGQTITITTKGGNGSGAVSFTQNAGGGCTLNQPVGSSTSATLTSTTARTCTITATKAGSGKYKPSTSQSVVFTFKVG